MTAIQRMPAERALALLMNAARVSPALRDAVADVDHEIRSLRQDLVTAHLVVASDATDAPGVISHAIRPFLEGALDRHGITPVDDGRKGAPPMSAADYLDKRLDATMPPCRDTRVLRWLVGVLGADLLLDIIDAQRGGNLGERVQRERARERIEELA